MEFGEFLRSKRLAKKMSIRQVALYAGCSDSYLSLLERGANGQRGPTPAFLRRLVKPLGVPYEVLMAAAGYVLQTEDEMYLPGSILLMLRDSLGDSAEAFAKRVNMITHEIEALEESGVSYETLNHIFQKLYEQQRLLSINQKELIHRLEGTLPEISSETSIYFETLVHSVLNIVGHEGRAK